ncbi:acyl-CoA dehydrogenase family protein [Actinacidiphila sp. bgisy145]|uniref:acyl-CoA dehydrogenase family protein n=1 Tax=Actinacidiphila sp. bgisy145 TaxID=3413792 RepID=UPI003EB78D8F
MAIDFTFEPDLVELRERTADFVRAVVLPAEQELLRQAAWTLDQGGGKHESSVAKTFTAEAVGRVVDRAVQVCGALGISGDLPLAAYLREVRPFRIYDGPSETHRWSIGRRALRRIGTADA